MKDLLSESRTNMDYDTYYVSHRQDLETRNKTFRDLGKIHRLPGKSEGMG